MSSPIVFGRFNYVSVIRDIVDGTKLYNVQFTPMQGPSVMIIAKNLDEVQAKELTRRFNEHIDDLRSELVEERVNND